MKNPILPGNTATFTASGTVSSGQGVHMGALFGVATTDVAPSVAVRLNGAAV